MISPSTTVWQLALEVPNAMRILQRIGIDYRQAGEESLRQACQRAGLPVPRVVRWLELGSRIPSLPVSPVHPALPPAAWPERTFQEVSQK